MMTIETLMIDKQEKKKKFEQLKDFLSKHLNSKLKIVIFLFVFIIFNGSLGYLNSKEVGINMFLLIIAFAVISIVDGVFIHKED